MFNNAASDKEIEKEEKLKGLETFINCGQPFPTNRKLFEGYAKRIKEFDKKYNRLKRKLPLDSYEINKHYYGLGLEG